VLVQIADRSSRPVAVIGRGDMTPGPNGRAWGGLDSRSRAVPPGSYFFTLWFDGRQVAKAPIRVP